MLNNYTQTVNASASSLINGKPVVYMVASIRSGEAPSINSAYQDMELYNQNKSEVDADFEEFKDRVFAISGGGDMIE